MGAGGALQRNLPQIHPAPWLPFKALRLCSVAAARGPQCALGALWRRLTARCLLPLEPRLQHREDRAESRVSPRKSDRQGLFYGEGEGAGSVASISRRAGTENPDGGSPIWVGDDQGDRMGQRQWGPRPLSVGPEQARAGKGTDRQTGNPELTSLPSSALPEPPLQSQTQPTAPALPPRPGVGETFSIETLDTNFVFLARKISLVWKGGVVDE